MYYVILVFLCIPIKMCLSGAQERETPIRMSPSFYLQAAIGGLLFWLSLL